MWFSSRWRLAAVSGAVLASTAFGLTASSADPADDYTPQPGLPRASELGSNRPGYDISAVPFSWYGITQVGRAGSVPAKQWTRIPVTLMATQVFFLTSQDPTPPKASEGFTNTWNFFVSPKGSEHNYGESAPITVRTVAFGSIPVEVKLQVVQQRTNTGVPKALELESANGNTSRPGQSDREYAESQPFSDGVFTRISAVKVDGVDLDVNDACQTAEPGSLTLEGTYAEDSNPLDATIIQGEYDPAGEDDLLLGVAGGNLSGTIDIGRFANCKTPSGDDISPLLTSAISAPDNPLRIRLGTLNCWTYNDDFTGFLPPPPGAETPQEGYCEAVTPDPGNPAFPKYVTVPPPVSLPDYAPGDQPNQ